MNDCPDAEILGAFIDGTLTGEPLRDVTEHLAACEECMSVMSAARFLEEEKPPVAIASHRRFSGRMRFAAIAAAVALLAGTAALIALVRMRSEAGIPSLIAAAPSNWRTVEPRLAGFPWAELRRMRAGEQPPPDPESLQLGGVAGKVLRQSHDPHATGVAELLVGQPAEAIARLRIATETRRDDAAAWNDLAAAYLASAAEGRTGDLPEALAAADRALKLRPSFAEAMFNRALILERIGLRRDALLEWRAYLAIDPSSRWASEARSHVAALEASAANGDPEAMRKRYETDVLGRWGETSDPALLAGAKRVASELFARNGDALLADAVGAIERAPDVRTIAAAHAQYRNARLRYAAHDLATAERELLAAAAAFDRCGSPMRDVSRLYAASAIFDENRIRDAESLFEDILRDAAPAHRSLIAETHLQLGRCAMYEGRSNDAASEFLESIAIYRALGEMANVAVAEAGVADAFAALGDRRDAWTHRVAAFDLLSRSGGPKLLLALSTASHCELRDQRLASAGALLQLEIEEARTLGRPLLIADAYKRRALLHARLGEAAGAFADLREARAALNREADAGLRQRVETECAIADGVLLRGIDARRSVARLDDAISFLKTSGLRFALPEALLERARSHRVIGDVASAGGDFDAALREVDFTHPTDVAQSVREEAVDFQLARGDVSRAFAMVESSVPGVPAGTALLEYVLVPGGVAIFSITDRGLNHAVVQLDRASLLDSVHDVRERMEGRGDVDGSLAVLYERLIAPIPAAAARERSWVIVADRALQSVPWSALYDATHREYLVQRVELTTAPSAAVWMRNSRAVSTRTNDRLLLIEAENIGRSEAGDLARIYPEHELLAGAAATADRILRAAGGCDVLHFTGHARDAGARGEAALLFGSGDLRASQIARLRFGRPRLAVLAACGTSAMAAAFLDAGIPAVVSTLWPIEDAPSALLFTEFHRRMHGGESAAGALRDAQISMIHAGVHPAVWAAVEIQGGSA